MEKHLSQLIELKEYYQFGIIAEVFQAERNLFIWKAIADEVPFLETQPKETRQLYAYIQTTASTNFILHTSKIFDKKNKYPTRSITSFLDLISEYSRLLPKIIETTSTINLLRKFETPLNLIEAVKSDDYTLFPTEFYKYYKTKYHEKEIQNGIIQIKEIRDKNIAHNESLSTTFKVNFESIALLLNFAMEIASIYGMAYESTFWGHDGKSHLMLNVERESFFILDSLKRIKEH